MSIFNHNVYDNIRTRVIVLHHNSLLLLPPPDADSGWQVPGGGLEPNESLSDCAVREVLEETGLRVQVVSVGFLREWVVPQYCPMPDQPDGVGYGLEVFLYAHPLDEKMELQQEEGAPGMPRWVPLDEVSALPLWPKELKTLAKTLLAGTHVYGAPSFVSQLESPLAAAPEVNFGLRYL